MEPGSTGTSERQQHQPARVTSPLVSALIVSYNVRTSLLETLKAFYSSNYSPIEAIVVDNASVDESVEAVEAQQPKATVIRLEQNLGFGRANNAGLAACKGEFILLLNPDVVVREDCVRILAEFLAENPAAGAVGPTLKRPDGRLDLAARRSFPSPTSALYRFLGLNRLFPKSPRFNRYNLGHVSTATVHEIDSGTAACLMVRRAAIDQVGFFDPDYFMYGEDLDLSYRLRAHQWKIYFVPDAVAVHLKGTSTRQAAGRMRYEFHRAMWLFHRKHYASNTPSIGNALIWTGIWARWAALSVRAWITRDSRISP
jgi:GT2 family glycosyltransferase